jgi:hypothetical protein
VHSLSHQFQIVETFVRSLGEVNNQRKKPKTKKKWKRRKSASSHSWKFGHRTCSEDDRHSAFVCERNQKKKKKQRETVTCTNVILIKSRKWG